MSEFEWDDAKNASNLQKHGISFEEAIHIFAGPVLTRTDHHHESGELRELSFGLLGGIVVLAVAHTDRNGKTRIISARKATAKERKAFHDYLEKALGRD
jgi:uncharacterized DUF497 family protein